MPLPRDPATLAGGCPALLPARAGRRRRSPSALGTSRSNVSRMLSEAQKQGIVEIRINDPDGRVHELEESCARPSACATCGSPTPASPPGLRLEDAGRHPGRPAARREPQGLDDGGAVLGPRPAGDGLRDHRRPGAPPAHPGPAGRRPVLDPQRDQRPGAGPRARRTPRRRRTASCTHRPRSESSTSRDALLAEPSIADALDDGGRADLAVRRHRHPHATARRPRSSTRSTSASRASSRRSGTHDPVGDIAARYYGAAAASRSTAPSRTGSSASTLDDLIAIPHVIGVAYGRAKTPGVLGALRGHLIDSLVCDEALARHLLSEARSRARIRQRRFLHADRLVR